MKQKVQPIRLSIITETYPPDINGVAHTIHHLVKGLRQLPHYQIQLIRLAQLNEPIKQHNICQNFTEIALKGFSLPFYKEVRVGLPHYYYLLSLWKKQRPDIVQIVTEGLLGWAALKAARRLNIPVISDFHTHFAQYIQHYRLGFAFKWANAYLRSLHNQTLLTLVPTLELKQQLSQQGYQNLALLSRGIDTELFNPRRRQTTLREHWQVQANQLVVVLVTRLAVEKNLDLAFQAFRAIQAQVSDAKFVIVGDGPERLRLQALYSDCLFVGMQHGLHLAQHYASADLFLYPSTSETYGNVIVEAMASGLPVLSFDYAAAHQHIRTGENGWVVPFADHAAFMQASVELALQPTLCQRLGQQAALTASQLSWSKVVVQLDQHIQGIVSTYSAG